MFKYFLSFFLTTSTTLLFSQNIDYTGEWTDSSPTSTVSSVKIIPGEKFENTLTQD